MNCFNLCVVLLCIGLVAFYCLWKQTKVSCTIDTNLTVTEPLKVIDLGGYFDNSFL